MWCRRAREEAAAREEKKKRKKNLGLLSFGEEAETEEHDTEALPHAKKIKSAHDLIDDER